MKIPLIEKHNIKSSPEKSYQCNPLMEMDNYFPGAFFTLVPSNPNPVTPHGSELKPGCKHRHSDRAMHQCNRLGLGLSAQIRKAQQPFFFSTPLIFIDKVFLKSFKHSKLNAYCHIIESLTFVFMRLLLNTEYFPLSKFFLLKCSTPSQVGRSPQPSLLHFRYCSE